MLMLKLFYFFLIAFCVPALFWFAFWVSGLMGLEPWVCIVVAAWLMAVWGAVDMAFKLGKT